MFVLFACVYFLPATIAGFRRHYQYGALLVGTLTFPTALYLLPSGALGVVYPLDLLPLPWAALMVWACLPRPAGVPKPSPAWTAPMPPTPKEALLWGSLLVVGLIGLAYYLSHH